jgi:hypothetical protein
MMYERRIENSLYKTIRELKKLQKEKMQNKPNYEAKRRAPEIGPFYLSTQQDNPGAPSPLHQKMQNEPNFTPHAPKNPINHPRPQADYTNNQSIINNQLKAPIKLTADSLNIEAKR